MNYLWLIKIRVNRREEREVRIMAAVCENDQKSLEAAHREVKRQFPACRIISQRRPISTPFAPPMPVRVVETKAVEFHQPPIMNGQK